jgi:hypothetical protein
LSSTSCPKCKKSHGEILLRKFLTAYKNNGIILSFIEQYRILECKDKRPLPFDFYVEVKDFYFLIEFNGEQHNKSIKYFGGEEKYKDRIKKDKIKKDFCKNNDIKLIEIPYSKIDNIEKILEDALNLQSRKEV